MVEETIPRYKIEIFWSDEDDAYIAVLPELPYCSAWGDTYEEALAQARDAIRGHIEVRRETGRPIPEPKSHDGIDRNEQPARKVNESAQRFAEAVRESMQTVSDQSMEAQERSRQLTQSFFDSVAQKLQVESKAVSQQSKLMEQARNQQEAFQQLVEEAMGAYSEFLDSLFFYYRVNKELQEKKDIRRLPIEDYDELYVSEVTAKLDSLSTAELEKVRDYEKRTKNRESIIEQIERKIKTAS